MRLIPVCTDADLGQQRHAELRHASHQFRHFGPDPVNLSLGHLEHQFIVDLHHDARGALLIVEDVRAQLQEAPESAWAG